MQYSYMLILLVFDLMNMTSARVVRHKRDDVLDHLLGFLSSRGGPDAQFGGGGNTMVNWRDPNQFDLSRNKFNGVLGTGWKNGWGVTGGQLGGGFQKGNSIPFLGEGNLWSNQQKYGWDMTNFQWDGGRQIGVGPWNNAFSRKSTFALPIIPNAINSLAKQNGK